MSPFISAETISVHFHTLWTPLTYQGRVLQGRMGGEGTTSINSQFTVAFGNSGTGLGQSWGSQANAFLSTEIMSLVTSVNIYKYLLCAKFFVGSWTLSAFFAGARLAWGDKSFGAKKK